MPRPPRSPYTPEDRQRALTALYASGDEVDGEWVPNFTAVSRMEGMPTHPTLSKWWADRDATQDFRHLEAAQRAREEARQQGGEDFFRTVGESLKQGITWVLSPEHRGMRPIFDKDGNCLGEDYRVRPDQMARGYKDVTHTAEKMRELWGIGKQPGEPPSSPAEDEAAALELLTRSPHILARALAALPAEAQAAVITRAQQQEE